MLEAHGLDDAADRLGLSWGFGWDGESTTLAGGDRWLEHASALHGLALERRHAGSWHEASVLEPELLHEGVSVVVGVDAYEIDSPYTGREHLAHAVHLLAHRPHGVTIADRRGTAVELERERYRHAREAACVERCVMYLSRPAPTRPASDGEALAQIGGELDCARDELAVLDAYLVALPAFESHADVAGVAAERLMLGRLLARVARSVPAVGGAARMVASLTRRWYLAHTMARAARQGAALRPGRLVDLLRDVRVREVRALQELSAALVQVPVPRDAPERVVT